MDTTSYQVEHELQALKSDSFHTKAFLASNEITQFFFNIFMNKFLQYYYFNCETLNSSQSNRQLQHTLQNDLNNVDPQIANLLFEAGQS